MIKMEMINLSAATKPIGVAIITGVIVVLLGFIQDISSIIYTICISVAYLIGIISFVKSKKDKINIFFFVIITILYIAFLFRFNVFDFL
ncbi:hypothetical protein [Lentibacillus sp. Marseille-P4043]|uniref:hypothetical protein n=1 Tax=Lentibacillus sp. Marseille-P4043 TaxID=2040293 RepID=UPI00131A4D27|nr:hypothetical protein [Lentibacillus sp. Marseille-P4043]